MSKSKKNKMILKLCLLCYFLEVVLTFDVDSSGIRDSHIRDRSSIDDETTTHPDLEHSVDMVQSADKIFAEGKSKTFNPIWCDVLE